MGLCCYSAPPLPNLLPTPPSLHSWDPGLSLINKLHLRVGFPGSPGGATCSDLPPAPSSLRSRSCRARGHPYPEPRPHSRYPGPQSPAPGAQASSQSLPGASSGAATGRMELRRASPRDRSDGPGGGPGASSLRHGTRVQDSKFESGLKGCDEGIYLVSLGA